MIIEKTNLLPFVIVFMAPCVIAHGDVVTFQEQVCQHCNASGYTGLPPVQINELTIREIVREVIENALEEFRSKSQEREVAGSSSDWTVFQRRMDGAVRFNRGWNDYVSGFGNRDGEFWLGLEKLHQLTKTGENELRIDVIGRNGIQLRAEYSSFAVGPASDNYRLHVTGFCGNASNYFGFWHNNMQFTTKDTDNDAHSTINCGSHFKGGWWFKDCGTNLNGIYRRRNWEGVRWHNHYGFMLLRFTEMKFRRRQ